MNFEKDFQYFLPEDFLGVGVSLNRNNPDEVHCDEDEEPNVTVGLK